MSKAEAGDLEEIVQMSRNQAEEMDRRMEMLKQQQSCPLQELKKHVETSYKYVSFTSNDVFWNNEKKKKMNGVHGIISSLFCSMTQAEIEEHMKKNKIKRHDPQGPAKRGRTVKYSKTVPKVTKDTRGCKNPGDKKKHGSTVDTEVGIFCQVRGKLDMFLKEIPDPDPCTLGIIEFLVKHKLQPVISQLIVWDMILNMATAVDLMCMDEHGELVMIEIKATGHTSSEFYLEKMGHFKEPLSELPFSYKNQDMLQLMLTHLMFSRSTKLPCRRAILLRASGDVVFEYNMSPWAWSKEVRQVVWKHIETVRLNKGTQKRKAAETIMQNRAAREKRQKIWKPRSKVSHGLQLSPSIDANSF